MRECDKETNWAVTGPNNWCTAWRDRPRTDGHTKPHQTELRLVVFFFTAGTAVNFVATLSGMFGKGINTPLVSPVSLINHNTTPSSQHASYTRSQTRKYQRHIIYLIPKPRPCHLMLGGGHAPVVSPTHVSLQLSLTPEYFFSGRVGSTDDRGPPSISSQHTRKKPANRCSSGWRNH